MQFEQEKCNESQIDLINYLRKEYPLLSQRTSDSPIHETLIEMALVSFKNDDNRYYRNAFEFMLKHGKFHTSQELTNQEHQLIRKVIKRANKSFVKDDCYLNAQYIIRIDNSNKIKYCEGLATNNNNKSITHHSWLEINNKVIDLTWENENGNYTIGCFNDNTSYFGVTYPNKYIDNLWNSLNKAKPILLHYEDEILSKPFEVNH